MSKTSEPPGRCNACDELHTRQAMPRHLASCPGRAAPASNQRPVDAFHLVVEGLSYATGALYWLHALARANATLWDVDQFLRKQWLECCGHMSAFRMQGGSFESLPDDEFGPPAEAMKGARLADVLTPGQFFGYEYDFGSTTELQLSVAGRRKNAMKGRAKVQLLARNEPPSLACGACGKPATRVCAAGCEADEALVCRACAPEHECGEEMLSRLVSSPRTGVCGYPVDEPSGRRGTWVMAE